MGDQHLDIVVNKLKERYKVDVELSKPRVPSARRSARTPTWKASIRNSPADTDSTAM